MDDKRCKAIQSTARQTVDIMHSDSKEINFKVKTEKNTLEELKLWAKILLKSHWRKKGNSQSSHTKNQPRQLWYTGPQCLDTE